MNGPPSSAGSPVGTQRRRVLIIEDEPDIARGLRDALEFEGFDPVSAGLGAEGVRMLREQGADLVLLDLMLPDLNGFAVCELIRGSHPVIPIIMLTARSQEIDKIRGLASGADDYVTKPFSVGELVARINAVFRRLHRITPDEIIQIGNVIVYPRRHELSRGGQTSTLSFYEVEILRMLHEHSGEPVTRDELLEKIWGVSGLNQTRSVDNFVMKLRRKIEENPALPRHIVTIYGTGYKLVV